jgi:hypothetical protein
MQEERISEFSPLHMTAEYITILNVFATHPFIDVCVMNQPRNDFAMECHSCVNIQSDLWHDWSRNNSVSLSTPKGRNRSRMESGMPLVSHWYHWNRDVNNK